MAGRHFHRQLLCTGANRISPRVLRKLESLGIGKDGYFDKDDLVNAVGNLLDKESQNKLFKRLVLLAVFLLMFVVIINLALAYGEHLVCLWHGESGCFVTPPCTFRPANAPAEECRPPTAVAYMAKDTKIVDNVLRSKLTSTPVEVASADIRIGNDGSMLPRHHIRESYSSEFEETPVRTSLATQTEVIDTRFSDEHLSSLERLSIVTPAGVSVTLTVLGVVRIPGKDKRAEVADLFRSKWDTFADSRDDTVDNDMDEENSTDVTMEDVDMTAPAAPGTDQVRILTPAGVITVGPNMTLHADEKIAGFLADSGGYGFPGANVPHNLCDFHTHSPHCS